MSSFREQYAQFQMDGYDPVLDNREPPPLDPPDDEEPVTDYQPDQVATDWAHDTAKRVIERWQEYADRQRYRPPGDDPLARPHPAYWDGYKAALSIVKGELGIDGKGCVVQGFDKRGPKLSAYLND